MRSGAPVRRAATVGLAALGLAACATTAEGGSAQSPMTGCYQIEWNADMARLGLPWGFELLDVPLESAGDGAFRAVTRASATRRTDTPFNVWRPIDGERVRLGYAPAGGALTLTVHREDDQLVGMVQSIGDALEPGQDPGPRPPEFIRAWKVVCPRP